MLHIVLTNKETYVKIVAETGSNILRSDNNRFFI